MNKIIFVIPIILPALLLLIPYVMYMDNFVMYQNSDSMYPTILPGDLLIIEQSEINDVRIGDIIAFNTHAQGVEVLVRRVIEASTGNDGRFGVDTQGDDEDFHDPWTIYSDEYIGKISEINPTLGFLLADYFQYPLLIVIMISISLLVRELLPKKGMQVKELVCLRCSHKWHPRIINGVTKYPETCANKKCRSPYWQTLRNTHP